MLNTKFFVFVDVYKLYEGNDYLKTYDVLSTLKKLKTNDILIEQY